MMRIEALNTRTLMVPAFILSAALSTTAMAQATFDGSYTGPSTSTTVVGASTTETTGDSSVAPFENTTTTYTDETVTTTTPPATQVVSTIVNGHNYTGNIDYSGAGEQEQIHETSITNTYDPGPPPSVTGTIVNPDVITPGAATITAISASGQVGNPDNFGATLYTSGPIVDGQVVATEDSVVMTSSGVVYAQRKGMATYDPGTGTVHVALPASPTSFTSITSDGVSTSGNISTGGHMSAGGNLSVGGNATVGGDMAVAGTVSASGFDANNGRVRNVGTAIDPTDAVNLGQVNSLIAQNNSVLIDSIDETRRRADAGTAVAVALSGGTFLPDKKFNLTANVGGYRSQAAIAAQVGFLVSENVALNAGVAKGFTRRGATAWRGGLSFGF